MFILTFLLSLLFLGHFSYLYMEFYTYVDKSELLCSIFSILLHNWTYLDLVYTSIIDKGVGCAQNASSNFLMKVMQRK